MPWNPQQYNQFSDLRDAPLRDLLRLLSPQSQMGVIDLGCGTGAGTATLAAYLRDATVLGIDASKEMLTKTPYRSRLTFQHRSIEQQLTRPDTFNLIFSNAALQWVDNHKSLFPRLIAQLKPGGQLAVQMPSQAENKLNFLLQELAAESPFATALNGFSYISPVLPMEDYAQLLFEQGGAEISVLKKIYPMEVKQTRELYQFVAGSALIPYLERIKSEMRNTFIAYYQRRIQNAFPTMPALYPFKRILIHAVFPKKV